MVIVAGEITDVSPWTYIKTSGFIDNHSYMLANKQQHILYYCVKDVLQRRERYELLADAENLYRTKLLVNFQNYKT